MRRGRVNLDDECNRLLQCRNTSHLHISKVAPFNLEELNSMTSCQANQRGLEMKATKAVRRIGALATKVKDSCQDAFA